MELLKEKVKVIFFDLDNTLWNFDMNSKITLGELYDEYIKVLDIKNFGREKFIEVFTANNDALWEKYRDGKITKTVLRFLRFYDTLSSMGIENEELVYEIDTKYLTNTSYKKNVIDNAFEILNYLFGKYELGLITNGFDEAQQIKLKNCGLDKYFKHIYVSEKVGAQKPNPVIFKYALKDSNKGADEAVYIGDDFNIDVIGAYNAGIYPIWLNKSNLNHTGDTDYMEIKDLIELKKVF